MKQPFYAWDDAEPKDAIERLSAPAPDVATVDQIMALADDDWKRFEFRTAVEKLAKDAARYRWLRHTMRGDMFVIRANSFEGDTILMGDELDAAVDAAMEPK